MLNEHASIISFYLAALRASRTGDTCIELSKTDATPTAPSDRVVEEVVTKGEPSGTRL